MTFSYPPTPVPTTLGDGARSDPPELAYAVVLAGAAERMAEAEALDELWPRMAREAVLLIDADVVGIVEYRQLVWRPLAVQTRNGVTDMERFTAGVDRAASRGLLLDPGWSDDLGDGAPAAGWESALVVEIDRRPRETMTRLVWLTSGGDGLGTHADVAALLGQHAGVAARAVHTRETLNEAVTARHRIGQAQGILMARYGLTTEQAFGALRLRSQHTNTKLRTLAEQVIATGALPAEHRPA